MILFGLGRYITFRKNFFSN